MPTLNLCQFMGNVGNIKTRYAADGSAVVNLSLACNEKWKDKNGEAQEHCEWVKVVMFGKLAAIASEYVNKGDPLYVSGKQRTRKWQDKDGQDRWSTEAVCNQMQMLSGKSDGQAPQKPAQQEQAPSGSGPMEHADDMNDDIPFVRPARGLEV